MSPAPTLAQQQAHAAATQLLSDWGIDPHDVLASSGLTAEGYDTLTRDTDGNTLLDIHGGGVLTEARAWPPGFPVETFLAAAREWQGATL